MKWTLANGYILDENGKMVCVLPDDADKQTVSIILAIPKILEAMLSFVEQTDVGRLRARRCYNDFKQIIDELKLKNVYEGS